MGREADRRDTLEAIEAEVVVCRACPRLVAWREQVAREKVARFADQEYWGRPVPGFGDPSARIAIVGLAPAAHGGNRTGRIFTGDRSGDFLFSALADLRAIVALGAYAWDGSLRALRANGHVAVPKPRFGHGMTASVGPFALIGCFHPSQQNTFTGKLTAAMLDEVLERARALAL